MSFEYIRVTLLCVLLVACDRHLNSPIDFGEYNSGVYRNKYFNVETKYPESWYQSGPSKINRQTIRASKILSGNDKSVSYSLKDNDFNELLLVSEHPINSKFKI